MNILNKLFKKKETANPDFMYIVGGMHCSSCATNIEVVVEEIDGVKKAEISMTTGRLKVWGDKKADDLIVKSVEDLGYNIAKI